ncbi:hypothetical protein CICLE_v10010554mg [Citrus x clementina]|uniref:DUF4216 domain-containing protein n=1 Tax=Citrus clementina TaxID=85681 RepID=V4TWN9_CITCL|nr:hypothetical protein CICLE_v10010554mg [Citrus x clementina]
MGNRLLDSLPQNEKIDFLLIGLVEHHSIKTGSLGDHLSYTLRYLAHRPLPFVIKHNGYDINGFYIVTRDQDSSRVTQNSIASFDWVQNSCVKKHELGFILVDLNKLGYKYDLFILTSQAKQVLYVNDHIQTKWYILCHMPTKSNPNQINEDEKISRVNKNMRALNKSNHRLMHRIRSFERLNRQE